MKKNTHIPQEIFERIECYLLEQMSKESRLDFEKELTHNSLLREQLEEIRELLLNVEAAILHEQLDDFHREIPHKQHNGGKKHKIPTRKLYYLSAAIAACMLAVYWLWPETSTTDRIFAKHYTPDPGLPTVMSSTNQYDFYNGMVDYKQKKYRQALDKWLSVLVKKPKNDTVNYFIGSAHLALGETEKAIQHLDVSLQTENSIFEEDAAFYQALALIKFEKPQAAIKILQQYPSEKGNRLLSELNNLLRP